jgi:hypothetical protein
MKFRKSAAREALALALGFLMCAAAAAQNQPAPAPAPQQPAPAAPQSAQPAPQPAATGGKVIFSRSLDENGQETTETGPAANPKIAIAKAPIAADADRDAVTFTAYDLDVHLRPAEHAIAVRARLTVRNDGKTPLALIPLEISSTLNWERIRVSGPNGSPNASPNPSQDAAFEVATLNSDTDHTGQLREAAVKLASPLAPGASLQLDADYSGTIDQSAQRLLSLGTPEDAALRSDWDRIDTEFTGLRGFGNVVWYPASAPPVVLGDGARLFDEIGAQKQRMADARFHLRLTVEFPHGQAPAIALVNGNPVTLAVTDSAASGEEVSGVATGEFTQAALGFETPSLFATIRTRHDGANMAAWTRTDDDANAESWAQAEKAVTPFLADWLGDKPRTGLTLLDLPEAQDAPFETGPLLVTGIEDGDPEQLKAILAHALTHAWIAAPNAPPRPVWLSEGLASFMSSLWTERQFGRAKALSALEAGRSALALAEPASPGEGPGEPLAHAVSPVYYRTKAAYVLWMLRGITSDDALSAALRGYDPAKETAGQAPSQLKTLLEKAANTDLKWFFADWVDADHGLPDLTIDNVFSSPERSGNWLVAVRLSNAGYAAAEIPVTVRTTGTYVTQRVRVPARGSVTPRILIQGKPTEVQANDGTVPETTSTVHVTKLDETSGAAPAASPTPPQP